MRITLCENMRALPYVPFYLALAGDFWASEGLDIRHVVSPSTATATALLDGAVDVSWGGPMRVMLHHDADPRCPLVCFGQVVARDPFLLVGHTRKPGFRWRDLAGRLGRSSEQAPQKLKGIKTKPAPVSGTPVLVDALGWVECRVVATLPAGDHTLVLGEIEAAGVEHEGAPLTLQEAGFKYSG